MPQTKPGTTLLSKVGEVGGHGEVVRSSRHNSSYGLVPKALQENRQKPKLALTSHERVSVHSCAGWSEQRVQEYFEWAAQVVKGLQGTNQQLEEALKQLFEERGLTL